MGGWGGGQPCNADRPSACRTQCRSSLRASGRHFVEMVGRALEPCRESWCPLLPYTNRRMHSLLGPLGVVRLPDVVHGVLKVEEHGQRHAQLGCRAGRTRMLSMLCMRCSAQSLRRRLHNNVRIVVQCRCERAACTDCKPAHALPPRRTQREQAAQPEVERDAAVRPKRAQQANNDRDQAHDAHDQHAAAA